MSSMIAVPSPPQGGFLGVTAIMNSPLHFKKQNQVRTGP